MRLRGLFHGPELRWYYTKAVTLRSRLSLCVFLAVMACLSVAIAETQKAPDLDRQFQVLSRNIIPATSLKPPRTTDPGAAGS